MTNEKPKVPAGADGVARNLFAEINVEKWSGVLVFH
jgi:hypothetical protein